MQIRHLPGWYTSKFMSVSVVIPAYNAMDTIAEALESLCAQTLTDWEAIVVNDGSTDDTAVIVADFAARDGRIRLVNQPNAGGGSARNKGIELAQYEWLLFFDADDWLLPHHLEKMTEALSSHDSSIDAVHCGWQRVDPQGKLGREDFGPTAADLFPTFAQRCAFMIHTCIVRGSLAEAVGGFDASLRTCQDWDFWQRIARAGARFHHIPEVLARYRSRPGSVSLDGRQQLKDSLRVISQAFGPDPRVPQPAPEYINGLARDGLSRARVRFACWSIGLVLGAGQDARPLLVYLAGDADPALDPAYVATCIFEAALLPGGLSAHGWDTLWPVTQENVTQFLEQFEQHTQAPDLAQQTQRHLERLILEHSRQTLPLTVGGTHAVALEITRPIVDLTLPAGVQHLRGEVRLEGDPLGVIELSAADNFIAGEEIVENIAHEFAWPIIGRYFQHHIFPSLQLGRTQNKTAVWRGDVFLGNIETGDEKTFWARVHDKIGWTLFLQEIWDRPAWPNAYFYDPEIVEPCDRRLDTALNPLTVDLGRPLPNLTTEAEQLDVLITIGESIIAPLKLTASHHFVSAQQLRVAITSAIGFDLCRAVVRLTLIGSPLKTRSSLRIHLEKLIAHQEQ